MVSIGKRNRLRADHAARMEPVVPEGEALKKLPPELPGGRGAARREEEGSEVSS